MKNGRFLIAGGYDSAGNRQYMVEIYNPLLDLFTTLPVSPKTHAGTVVVLPNGSVMLSGVDGSGKPATQLFCP